MNNNHKYSDNEEQSLQARKKLYAKFNLREFGGALGDWGTLIPFIIG